MNTVSRGLFLALLFLSSSFFLQLPAASSAGEIDHSLFAELLQRHVKEGVVDYGGFREDEPMLDRYLDLLAKVKTEDLSRNEQFAFYVNVYNAWTIKLILSKYPDIDSIKDLGGLFQTPWEKKIVEIEGKTLTLDDVEHKILRKRFADPRVHFAVNCASKGCPPLRSEPYRGSHLDAQLDAMVSSFMNDPRRTRLEGQTLYVSKIFKWFSEDFTGGLLPFVLRYATGDFKDRLEAAKKDIRIRYLEYDWSLNGP